MGIEIRKEIKLSIQNEESQSGKISDFLALSKNSVSFRMYSVNGSSITFISFFGFTFRGALIPFWPSCSQSMLSKNARFFILLYSSTSRLLGFFDKSLDIKILPSLSV